MIRWNCAFVLAFSLFLFATCGTKKAAPAVNEIVEPVYVATGNEPFWSVRIQPDEISFTRMGEEREVYPYRPPVLSAKMISYLAKGDAGELRVTFLERPCQDSMSGESFAYNVTVEKDGKVWKGCGGTE